MFVAAHQASAVRPPHTAASSHGGDWPTARPFGRAADSLAASSSFSNLSASVMVTVAGAMGRPSAASAPRAAHVAACHAAVSSSASVRPFARIMGHTRPPVRRSGAPMCRSEAGLPTAAPRAATRAPAPTGTPPPVPGTRLVWFKHDLRVDDHPGLVAAAAPGGRALCVYVLDPVLAARTSPGPCGAAALAGALACLRSSLRVRGADLVVVRAGPAGAAAAVADLAARVGAAAVYAEEEVVFG